MRSLTVQIPQPCHENWADMQPNDQGRFCASCQKTVVDYTALSDQELVKLLYKASHQTCGRFRDEQLNRPLVLSDQENTPVWRHWLGLLAMTLFGWQTAQAQVSPANKPPRPVSVRPDYSVATLPVQVTSGPNKKWIITGRVMLMDSSGNLSPLPNADISISRLAKPYRTQTDSSGVFRLEVPAEMQATELTAWVYAPERIHGNTTFNASLFTTLYALDDMILHKPTHMPMKNITGGGICLVQTPSRWQRLKRKLFH